MEEQTQQPEVPAFQIDDGLLEQLDNIETRKAAYERLASSVLQQADQILQQRLEAWQQKLNPLMQFYQQQQQKAALEAFGSRYPHLAKPELLPIVDAVAGKLDPKQYGSVDDAFKAVAEGVEAALKAANVSGGIPVTTPSGGGNVGSGKPPTEGSKPKALEILGGVRGA